MARTFMRINHTTVYHPTPLKKQPRFAQQLTHNPRQWGSYSHYELHWGKEILAENVKIKMRKSGHVGKQNGIHIIVGTDQGDDAATIFANPEHGTSAGPERPLSQKIQQKYVAYLGYYQCTICPSFCKKGWKLEAGISTYEMGYMWSPSVITHIVRTQTISKGLRNAGFAAQM